MLLYMLSNRYISRACDAQKLSTWGYAAYGRAGSLKEMPKNVRKLGFC